MCINTSNFFTRSRPIWERRGSLTLPALLALPRLRGGDPGRSEVRPPPSPRLGRPDPARRSAPLLRGLRHPLPPPRRGLGMGPATGTGLRGNLQPSFAFIYVFFGFVIGFGFFYSTWGLPGVSVPSGIICCPQTQLEI